MSGSHRAPDAGVESSGSGAFDARGSEAGSGSATASPKPSGSHTSLHDLRNLPAPWTPIVLYCLLPGALAGTQLAGLLFFLNPHLPFSPLNVSRGLLISALILGVLGAPPLLFFVRRKQHRLNRLLPVALTLVMMVSAVGYWTHAYYFGFYLPPGINIRLLKAAISLTLAALVCFYTVLVHRLRGRPYGRRSAFLFLALSLLAIYVVVERREAFRPRVELTRATTIESSTRPVLCVVGLEAATLDAILPLAEQGRLPFFADILSRGVQARLGTLEPTRRTPAWVSLVTGKYPYEHGVVGETLREAHFLGSTEPERHLDLLPVGLRPLGLFPEVRAVASTDLRSSTLWQILERLGSNATVVGWPATDPPDARATNLVSDRFFTEGASPEHASSLELAQRSALFDTPIEEIDPKHLSRFGMTPPEPVVEALREDVWRQDLGLFLLDRDPPTDALFLFLPGLGEVSKRYFGGFSASQFEGRQEPESVEAARLSSAYYEHLDEYLGRLWAALPSQRMLVVVSAHGVHEPRGLREVSRFLLRQPATRGYFDDTPDGVLLLLGDGVRAGSTVREADLLDLVPTLLYGLGFPVARDLDGTVLIDAFDTAYMARRPLTFVPSYETLSRPKD
ncbi:MAG: alkaline phosphatase family protein [Holophagales bacterium]|nr:alkaline phosphatase family protein [Holophagales bacterium]